MVYTGEKLSQIIFPLGGIGSGSIGLCGNGEFKDWEIFNRPNKGSINQYSHFAVRAQYPDGRSVTRVLQGDHVSDLSGQYSKTQFDGFGYGPSSGTMAGFAHFNKVTFEGTFPVATLRFEDEGFPAVVTLTAFNPLIPLDADASSIPAAFFDLAVDSREAGVTYTLVLSVRNPYVPSRNEQVESDKYTAVRMMHDGVDPEDKDYGDLTVAVAAPEGICQEYWYRGSWQDGVTTYWRELEEGNLPPRHYEESHKRDVCTVGVTGEHARFVISWNNPNHYHYWSPSQDENGNDIVWKNYYATLFASSRESAFYALDNWEDLWSRTATFRDILHRTTLDAAVVDAVSSHLSVLKSATVLRLDDGTFYGWEGVHEQAGSCEGTCTHVWSYAYALCFLFPELERSLRDTELQIDTDEHGFMLFRTVLPLSAPRNLDGHRAGAHACLDGQMATLFKAYRDWKISGDDEWLRASWPNLKKTLEFAWNEHNRDGWDLDHDGILEGRQHHTLDMELFGPSGWLQGMYLAALKAAAEMADYLEDTDKVLEYRALFENGYAYTRDNLFNGEYFIQKVDVTDKTPTEHFECPDYWNDEKGQLKYQIDEGCEIDQLLGQWHANVCGLGDIFDKEQRRIALQSLYRYNFKSSMRDFTNMWRVFALNDEGGAIMCDYPEGKNKPIIPIPYCEECMTGFEYALAGLMISEGMVEEGLTLVRAIRDRYDGKKRNPYNEIECGSNYARPMASFAMLPIFSGMEFDLPHGFVGFAPIVEGDYRTLWSLGTGWGEYLRQGNTQRITLAEGSLKLKSLRLAGDIKALTIDGKEIAFEREGDILRFAETTATKEICAK